MLSFFRTYQVIVIAGLLALIAMLAISLKTKQNGDLFFFEKIVYEITSPLQKAVEYSSRGVKSLCLNYIFLLNLKEENADLKRAVATLKMENSRLTEALAANARLKKLLDFKESIQAQMLPAEVIGYDPSSWFKTVLINKGVEDGISKNMAVVTSDGIVGRVVEVSRATSKLLLMTDHRSAIDAIVQRTRAKGILVGKVDQRCRLKYVFRSDDVTIGDDIITSGLGGTFPKGLPLGKVSRIKKNGYGMFQEVQVTPIVAFSKLEEVLVITANNHASDG